MDDVIRFPKRPVGVAPNMVHVCVMQSPACADDVCEACDGCGCECHPDTEDEMVGPFAAIREGAKTDG